MINGSEYILLIYVQNPYSWFRIYIVYQYTIYITPPSQDQVLFNSEISKLIDSNLRSCENMAILGDFNMEPNDPKMIPLLEDYSLHNSIRKSMCYKTKNGRCIDLILTNKEHSFLMNCSFETGYSVHHHMISTILKSTYTKVPSKKSDSDNIRISLKNFSRIDLINNLRYFIPSEYGELEKVIVTTLDQHAPIKTKIVRGNNKKHINKVMHTEIMLCFKLKKIANKTKNRDDIRCYKKQRNLIVNMNRKAKKDYYKSISPKSIDNDRKLWKMMKPLFSNVNPMSEKIILIGGEKIIAEDTKLAQCFNTYFLNITDSLGLSVPDNPDNNDRLNLDEMVTNAIKKYKNHPSIKAIKTSVRQDEKFRFSHLHPGYVKDEIEALDPKKSNSGDIPVKIIKNIKNTVVPFLTDCINAAINNCCFPNELRVADASPCNKKGAKTDKSNYRPISVLPAISKLFETLIGSQINHFFRKQMV